MRLLLYCTNNTKQMRNDKTFLCLRWRTKSRHSTKICPIAMHCIVKFQITRQLNCHSSCKALASMVENSSSLSAATLAQKSKIAFYYAGKTQSITQILVLWKAFRKISGRKCCMHKQYSCWNKCERNLFFFWECMKSTGLQHECRPEAESLYCWGLCRMSESWEELSWRM